MERLLNISVTPANIRFKMHNAQVKYNNHQPSGDLTVEKGGYKMAKTPGTLKVDMLDVKNDLGMKPVGVLIKESSEKGNAEFNKVVQNIVANGNQLALPHGKSIAQIAADSQILQYETNIEFIPSQMAKVSYTPEELNIDFTPDKVSINWNVKTMMELEYIRPNFEFEVLNDSDVQIEYTGEPLYIPRDYQPGKI